MKLTMPSSTSLWNEMRRVSLELDTLTPALLSPLGPQHVSVSAPGVGLAVAHGREESVYVLVANPSASAERLRVQVGWGYDGAVWLPFDDTSINDAIQVVSFFNYINRVADAVHVDLEPEMAPYPDEESGDS